MTNGQQYLLSNLLNLLLDRLLSVILLNVPSKLINQLAKLTIDPENLYNNNDDGPGGRNLPGITVSKHGGGKSSITGMEFSSDSGVCWDGPSSISYSGVSFVYEDEPTSTSFGHAGASPRPSGAMSDWIQ